MKDFISKILVVKPDWRKEQEDPMIGIRTQYVIYNQQPSTGPAEDLGVHLQLGQSERFQVFLNHENNGGLFLSISTGLKMKYWYFAQLELQFRQLQSLSFSIFKQ
ncbi:Hypothetical_protein [Hexamita inflata]|uniref:Hypothetical_protein n=1 Tax=Hexamita inflata TaxID=28002 RepID=A0ABP1HUD7_9EUKA